MSVLIDKKINTSGLRCCNIGDIVFPDNLRHLEMHDKEFLAIWEFEPGIYPITFKSLEDPYGCMKVSKRHFEISMPWIRVIQYNKGVCLYFAEKPLVETGTRDGYRLPELPHSRFNGLMCSEPYLDIFANNKIEKTLQLASEYFRSQLFSNNKYYLRTPSISLEEWELRTKENPNYGLQRRWASCNPWVEVSYLYFFDK